MKYFFFDFDGICSKDYAYDKEGKFMKTINAGSKEAIKLLHDNDYKAICISSDSSNVGQKIIKDWCEHVHADDLIFCKADEKMQIIADIVCYTDTVVFVGDDIYDEVLLHVVDRGYTTSSAVPLFRTFNNTNLTILKSDKPLLEAVIKEVNYVPNMQQYPLHILLKLKGIASLKYIADSYINFSTTNKDIVIYKNPEGLNIAIIAVNTNDELTLLTVNLLFAHLSIAQYPYLYVPKQLFDTYYEKFKEVFNPNSQIITYESEKTHI